MLAIGVKQMIRMIDDIRLCPQDLAAACADDFAIFFICGRCLACIGFSRTCSGRLVLLWHLARLRP